MDKNNLQPGDETFHDGEGDLAPSERFGSASGSDQPVDPAIARMTTAQPVEPDAPEEPR